MANEFGVFPHASTTLSLPTTIIGQRSGFTFNDAFFPVEKLNLASEPQFDI